MIWMSFVSSFLVGFVVSVFRNRGCMFSAKECLTWASSVSVRCLSWKVTHFLLLSSVVLKSSWFRTA